MARTLIGQLVLKAQDDASGVLKKAAANVSAAFNKIDADQKRLAQSAQFFDKKSGWGVGFQKQLDTLKLTSAEMARVKQSYTGLIDSVKAKGLGKALQSQEISAWRTATVSHFAAIRAEMGTTERRAKQHARIVQQAMKPLYLAGGGYTGLYFAGMGIRGGALASADRQRELFRQENAGLTLAERQRISITTSQLSAKLPSVSQTQGMEMFRNARGMMGTVDRADQIMPALYKGLVALQSAKGVDAGTQEMTRMLKGIDNLGKNSAGSMGIKDTMSIIEGMVKASQIEGADLDTGKLFDFARRAKIAGPGLSTDFIMTTAPALMQDMTAEGFGAALSSAYQAMVIGSSAVASKKNLEEQERIGIRKDGELVGDQLFAENPYLWAKQYLIPALEKSGVDITNEAEVSKAIAKLSRNTNATGLLTRLVTQKEQTDRLLDLYAQSKGFKGIEDARHKDPYLAAKAFTSSFGDLSAAIGQYITPSVLVGMNGMTDFVRKMAYYVQEYPALGQGIGVAAVGGGVLAAGLAAKSIYGLITAGTNLNIAAAALTRAAVAQGAGGVLDGAGGGTKGGFLRGLLRSVASVAVAYGAALAIQEAARRVNENPANVQRLREGESQLARLRNNLGNGYGDGLSGGSRSRGSPKRNELSNVYRRFHGDGVAPYPTARPSGAVPTPRPDFNNAEQAANEAGRKMQQALDIVARPTVDASGIQSALALAQRLLSTLQQAGSAAANVSVPYTDAMGGVYSDYGVAP